MDRGHGAIRALQMWEERWPLCEIYSSTLTAKATHANSVTESDERCSSKGFGAQPEMKLNFVHFEHKRLHYTWHHVPSDLAFLNLLAESVLIFYVLYCIVLRLWIETLVSKTRSAAEPRCYGKPETRV